MKKWYIIFILCVLAIPVVSAVPQCQTSPDNSSWTNVTWGVLDEDGGDDLGLVINLTPNTLYYIRCRDTAEGFDWGYDSFQTLSEWVVNMTGVAASLFIGTVCFIFAGLALAFFYFAMQAQRSMLWISLGLLCLVACLGTMFMGFIWIDTLIDNENFTLETDLLNIFGSGITFYGWVLRGFMVIGIIILLVYFGTKIYGLVGGKEGDVV